MQLSHRTVQAQHGGRITKVVLCLTVSLTFLLSPILSAQDREHTLSHQILTSLAENPKSLALMLLSGDPREMDTIATREGIYPLSAVTNNAEKLFQLPYAGHIRTPHQGLYRLTTLYPETNQHFYTTVPADVRQVVYKYTNLRMFEERFQKLNSQSEVTVTENLRRAAETLMYTIALYDRIVDIKNGRDFSFFPDEKQELYIELAARAQGWMDLAIWSFVDATTPQISALGDEELYAAERVKAHTIFTNILLATFDGQVPENELFPSGFNGILAKLRQVQTDRTRHDIDFQILEELRRSLTTIHNKYDERIADAEEALLYATMDRDRPSPRLMKQVLFLGGYFTVGLLLAIYDEQTYHIRNLWYETMVQSFVPWADLTFGKEAGNALTLIGHSWQNIVEWMSPLTEPIARGINYLSTTNEPIISENGVGHSMLAATALKILPLGHGLYTQVRRVDGYFRTRKTEHELAELKQKYAAELEKENNASYVSQKKLAYLEQSVAAAIRSARTECEKLISPSKEL